MFSWDPEQYSRFDRLRLRPALDLLAHVHHPSPRVVYDLGTGRGQIARLMAERWPEAKVIGTDTSADMLAEAAAEPSRVSWIEQDVRDWDPPDAPDVIYSNAMLHWVADHDDLIVNLARSLKPGGVIAIQMPFSWPEPSHRLMREVLASEGLGDAELRESLNRQPVAEPAHYHHLLQGVVADLDVWKTVFYQQLHGPDAVLEWVKGTALRPVLAGLDVDEQDRFLDVYSARLRVAYPEAQDGSTLFPFPRVFIVGTTDPAPA